MDPVEEFEQERKRYIEEMAQDQSLQNTARAFFTESWKARYSYNFDWLGVPIIQIPQDIAALQEIIWQVQPDLIIETGVARGGSLIFYASMIDLLGKGEVLGIDVDIRPHNREQIENHPMANHISMIEGSSVSNEVLGQVKEYTKNKETIMVVLDSNHTEEHVLKELEKYAPFVTKESYLVVFDTVVEYMPNSFFDNRPWGEGNNPATAVAKFLSKYQQFEIDKNIDTKLLISAAPGGYLKRVK